MDEIHETITTSTSINVYIYIILQNKREDKIYESIREPYGLALQHLLTMKIKLKMQQFSVIRLKAQFVFKRHFNVQILLSMTVFTHA